MIYGAEAWTLRRSEEGLLERNENAPMDAWYHTEGQEKK